jgi:hypothetical protein
MQLQGVFQIKSNQTGRNRGFGSPRCQYLKVKANPKRQVVKPRIERIVRMGSFRKASSIMLIIEQYFSRSSLHLIRFIRAIRGLNSGLYDLDCRWS